MKDLLSTRLILNHQKLKKAEEFGDMNLVVLLEIAKKNKEYQKLIKRVQNGCLRKK